jgi:hypothetical protein
MPFTAADKVIIADRMMRENWGATRILHAYPDKPATSPDLNVMDYHVWRRLKTLVYSRPIRNRAHLIFRIKMCWRNILSQNAINAAIDQWRERLENVVLQRGGHIEQIYRNRH